MANSATVVSLTGHAWIRNNDGSRTELHVGSKIPPGSEILTEANGLLQMVIDGESIAQPITISGGRDVAFSGEMSAAVQDVSQSQAQVPAGTDSDRLLQALNSGQDLLANLESAGAVGGAGGGGVGGSSDAGFVVLARIALGTSPLGWGYPNGLPTVPELLVPPAIEQPVAAPEVAPTVTLTAGSVPTEITSDALTAHGTQFTVGNTDTASADFSTLFGVQETAGSAAITSTTQAFSLVIGNANTGLTSHGVAVVLSQDANGNLVGMAGNNVVFTISINAQTGQVSLHQVDALDHGTPGSVTGTIETLAAGSVLIQETVTATDANGNSGSQTAQADVSHAFAFVDDSPLVNVSAVDTSAPTLVTSDANLPSGTSPEALGADQATANFSSLFASAFNMGADAGPGSSESLVYSLSLTNGQPTMASGLSTEGSAITLKLVSGSEIDGVDGNNHVAFTVTLNSATGQVTLTQLEAIDHVAPTDALQTLSIAGINLTATGAITDDDGDTATASATANIGAALSFADDAPSVTVSVVAEQEVPSLVTSDANLPAGTSPEALGADQATANFSGLFSSTFVMGADNGPGSSESLAYSLSLTNGQPTMASGLSTEGSAITLTLVSGTEIDGIDSNNHVAFTLTVDSATGQVTLTQLEAIDHVAPGDALQTLSIAGINLTATGTITDDDGDTRTASATANIGGSLAFADDAPTVTVSLVDTSFPTVQTSDANLPAGTSPEPLGADHASADFSGLFSSTFVMGADNGPGSSESLVYSLALTNGQSTMASGLSTEGSAITLSLVSGSEIDGIDSHGHTAFTVTVDAATGHVTLTQFEAIDHIAPGDALQTLSLAGINLTALGTITDDDGDVRTASATANIGGSLAFADDAPMVTVSVTDTNVTQLVTSDANLPSGTSPEPLGADHATGDFSTLFSSAFVMGADNGPGSSESLVYSLALTNGQSTMASGLSTEGSAITLSLVSGTEIDGVDSHGHTAFTVTVDAATGHVTLTQFEAIDHIAPGDALQTLSLAGINLTASGTITDDDGDTRTGSATANIGASLAFADDAPTVSVSLTDATVTTVQTSDANLPSGTSPEPLGADHATGDFSTLFSSTFVMGADNGPGSSESLVYSLALTNGQSTMASGLSTEGSAITLSLVSGSEIDGIDSHGHTAFTVTVDTATGHVTLTQFEAIDHVAPGDALQTLSLAGINLTALGTITDDDGDVRTASATANIGASLAFADDAPTVSVSLTDATVTTVQTSDANLPSGTSPEALGADHATGDFSTLFTSTFVMGADNGPGSSESLVYSLALTNGQSTMASGLSTEGSAITLSLASGSEIDGIDSHGHTAFTVTVDAATGHVTLTQFEAIDHIAPGDALQTLSLAGINLTALGTITDDDGDVRTASATANIGASLAFADDAPTVTVSLTSATAPVLQTSDANLPSGTSPEPLGADHATGDFSTLFSSTFVMGADNGPGSSESLVYTLALTNGLTTMASGLSTDGSAITLSLASGSEIDGIDSHGHTAFTVTVDAATGHVTLTQFEAIDHIAPGDAPQTLSLAGINLTASGTITDDDGDTRTGSATANIGASLAFADDKPTVTVVTSGATAPTLETSDTFLPTGTDVAAGQPAQIGAEITAHTLNTSTDTATGHFAALFTITPTYGADGPATTNPEVITYSLSVGVNTDSGLKSHGTEIMLSLDGSGNVVGMAGATTVFVISVNATTGDVTLHQEAAIDQPGQGTGAVSMTAANLVTLTATATVTDFDGDVVTAHQAADITSAFAFADDVPQVTVVASGATAPTLETSDTFLPAGTDVAAGQPAQIGAEITAGTLNTTTDTATGHFASLFTITPTYGADGPAATNPDVITYSLSVGGGADSGLKSHGVEIMLSVDGSGNVVGMAGTTTVFLISVNATTGDVTLHQEAAIDQSGQGTGAVTLSGTNLVMLTATSLVTDFDGDTATAHQAVDISGAFAFADDVPKVTVAASGATVPTLETSDTFLPTGTDIAAGQPAQIGAEITAGSLNTSTDTVTVNMASLFTTTPTYGADGAATTNPLVTTYALSLASQNEATNLTSHGQAITLVMVGGVVEGVVNGNTANPIFTISVDAATGFVTLHQEAAIDQPGQGTGAVTLSGTNLVTLTATSTVTDFDGDTAAAHQAVDITGAVAFADDVPTFSFIQDAIVGDQAMTLTGTHNLVFGADGEGQINLSMTAISGITTTTTHNLDGSTTLVADAGTTEFFTLTVNPDGTYVFNLVTPNPSTTDLVDIGSVSAGGPVPSLPPITEPDGISITISAAAGHNINPATTGFGVDSNTINPGDEFTATFNSSNITGISFDVTKPVTVTWHTNTDPTIHTTSSVNGVLTISDSIDFSSITIDVTSAQNAKISDFSFQHSILTSNETLNFNVSATDFDGDTTAVVPLSVDLLGGAAGTTINGTSASEVIHGTTANETIYGGGGSDTLYGGGGADTFVWKLGDQGSTAAPAIDTIKDYNNGTNPINTTTNGDVLDLSNMLQGHSTSGYLHIGVNTSGQVEIDINTSGALNTSTGANANQEIVIANLSSLTGLGSGTSDQIITQMIHDGKMKVS